MMQTLLIIWKIEIINIKEFAKTVLDENVGAFMVYITWPIFKMLIHLAQKTGIPLLIIKKVIVLAKCLDYAIIFSKKLAIELSI